MNLLVSGKAPQAVSKFMAGGRLIALNKDKEGSPPDIRPIVVGESLRRLAGKCICASLKEKISSFFQPLQFGVACRAGAEKIVHSLRNCIEEHWMQDEDFVIFKVDMTNAFNLVSRQAVLDECSAFFPEILPWVSWCYGSHPELWHPMGHLSSQSGVQQGDPLGPMLFALVLQKLISTIDADDECLQLLLQAWYLDDGVLAGKRSAVLRALHLIEELGPHIGIVINFSKCEVFSPQGNHLFPPAVKSSLLPNLEILGVPIGDYLHCSHFIAEKCSKAKVLLTALVEVADADLHVAASLLRICGSYCKLVHLARTTPPSLSCESLKFFDEEVRRCFSICIAADIADDHWKQAQLSLSFGGLGFRSLSYHSCAAFISSLSSSGFGSASNRHLLSAISKFNSLVSPAEVITVESVLSSPLSQHALCKKLDDHLFQSILMTSSPANKARLLSASAPHASSWLSVVPSVGLGLHLDPAKYQIAVLWWLGMNSSIQSVCPFCPDITLDPLGHHAVSCRHGGDVVIRHNRLRNIFAEFCRRAHLSVRVEVGQGLSRVQSNSRPADVLVDAWERAKPAAFDVTVTSPLTPATLHDACNSAGVAAHKAECRKHSSNDPKCQELGWVCVPLAVESYGNWGKEAQNTFARLASILSISLHCPKAKVLTEIYGRLNTSLVRSVARAILSRRCVPG